MNPATQQTISPQSQALTIDLPVPVSQVGQFFPYPSRKVLEHHIASGATNGLFKSGGVYRAPGRGGVSTGRWMFSPAAYFKWLAGGSTPKRRARTQRG